MAQARQQAQQVAVNTSKGGVYDVTRDTSEQAILWCELFKERERALLRKRLKFETIFFSEAGFNVQLWVRHLLKEHNVTKGITGQTVLFLHALSGSLTSGWAWSKMLQPLHKAGLATIIVDLPGFGKSALNGKFELPASTWLHKDFEIVGKALVEAVPLSPRVQVVTAGASCMTAIRLAQFYREVCDKQQLWHNPIFDYEALFPEIPRGEATVTSRKKYRKLLSQIIVDAALWVWATYDASIAPEDHEDLQWLRTALGTRFQLTKVDATHLSEVQAGCNVPIKILYPSRQLKRAFVSFLNKEFGLKEMPAVLSKLAEDGPQEESCTDVSEAPSSALPSPLAAWAAEGSSRMLEALPEAPEGPQMMTMLPSQLRPGTQGRPQTQGTGSKLGGQVASLPSTQLMHKAASAPAMLDAASSQRPGTGCAVPLPSLEQVDVGGLQPRPSLRAVSRGQWPLELGEQRRAPSRSGGGREEGGPPSRGGHGSPSGARSALKTPKSRCGTGGTSRSMRSSASGWAASWAEEARHRLPAESSRLRDMRLVDVPDVKYQTNHDCEPPSDPNLGFDERIQLEDTLDFSNRAYLADQKARRVEEEAMMEATTSFASAGGRMVSGRQTISSNNQFAKRSVMRKSMAVGAQLLEGLK